MSYIGSRPANKAVTTTDIEDDAITSAKIATGTVVASDLGANSVDSSELVDGSVDISHLSATGTKSSSTYLRGDNSFATVSGFSASSITGATALAVQPASTDEIVLSDAGTLKRLDIKHIQNTPAFHAKDAQNGNMASATDEVIEFNAELFDSDSCYNTSTFKFTPAIAGKYFIYGAVRWQTSTNAATRIDVMIWKNGSTVAAQRNNNTDYSTTQIASIVDLDGDDYVQLVGNQNTGNTTAITPEDAYSFFGGFRISGVS